MAPMASSEPPNLKHLQEINQQQRTLIELLHHQLKAVLIDRDALALEAEKLQMQLVDVLGQQRAEEIAIDAAIARAVDCSDRTELLTSQTQAFLLSIANTEAAAVALGKIA